MAVDADSRLLLKPIEASSALSVSPRTLWSLTNGGRIPAGRIGRSVRYDPADLRQFVQPTKVTSRDATDEHAN